MINPVPQVVWTGFAQPDATYPTGLGDGTEGVAHLDELSVSWGRARFGEHHEPQTARFGFIAYGTERAASIASFDWLGQPVQLRWTAGATSRTFFRGRVTECRVSPRRPASSGASRGALVEFTATGALAELGNRLSGVETWPEETFDARMTRIKAIAGNAAGSITYRPYFTGAPLASRNVSNTDALSLLHSMWDSMGGDRLAYDPHTDAVGWVGRRAVPAMAAGSRYRAALWRDTVFGQGVAPRVATPTYAYPALDGRWIEWEAPKLTKALEQRVTRVEYTWAEAGATRTAVIYEPTLEARLGVTALTVSTEYRQKDWADQCGADWLSALWREGGRVQPDPLTYRADKAGGFPSLDHAQLLIGGAELYQSTSVGGSYSAVYVMGSPFAALGQAPAYGVIGGVIRYDSRGWRPTVHLQAVWHDDLTDQRPVRIGEMTLPGSPRDRFTLGELSRGVSVADFAHLAPRP